MSSNPDKIYHQKTMLEPVAPATRWLYPELKFIAGTMQRSALADAGRRAGRYWASYILRFSVLAVGVVGIWAIQADREDLKRVLTLALPLLFLTWLLLDYWRTRVELRSGARVEPQAVLTPNTLLERTRDR